MKNFYTLSVCRMVRAPFEVIKEGRGGCCLQRSLGVPQENEIICIEGSSHMKKCYLALQCCFLL